MLGPKRGHAHLVCRLVRWQVVHELAGKKWLVQLERSGHIGTGWRATVLLLRLRRGAYGMAMCVGSWPEPPMLLDCVLHVLLFGFRLVNFLHVLLLHLLDLLHLHDLHLVVDHHSMSDSPKGLLVPQWT